MNAANRQHKRSGYTIVEVMVVLAVSGIMFLIAATFISGKQERSAFTQGSNTFASNIQDVIEQVTDGQYSDIPVSCSYTVGAGNLVLDSAPSTLNQGGNSSCVFLGKLIWLSTAAGSSQYDIISLAGAALNGSATPTLTSILPTSIPRLTTQQTTPQALNITAVQVTPVSTTVNPTPSPTTAYSNIGFVQGLGATNGSGGYQSGAQNTQIVYATTTSEPAASSATLLPLQAASSAVICFTDGTQQAKLTFGNGASGGANGQLSVQVVYLNKGASCP